MCILFLNGDNNPAPNGFKLILASNRDEFYSRPASVAAIWDSDRSVYGGRDLEPGREGGTWLAIGTRNTIKVGALLNVTGEIKQKNCIGRGPIVTNYVTGDWSNEDYCRQLIDSNDIYNAFNFVSVEISDEDMKILHCSNTPPSIIECAQGESLGFGNSPLQQPFQKVRVGTREFTHITQNITKNSREILSENLMELLKTDLKFWPDDELKKRAPQYGESLSKICVRMSEAGYGSRTRTVILIDADNRMDFYEETMNTPDASDEWKRTHITKQL